MPLGDAVLDNFWSLFALQFPDHPVTKDFETGATAKQRLIPLNIHGDGGRTYKKSEIMILQFQPVLGQGTSLGRRTTGQKRKQDGQDPALEVNMQGHSMATRFLMSVLCKKFYENDVQPLLKLMGFVSDAFDKLYKKGLTVHGEQFKFLAIGLKGDLVFQAKVCQLERSFSHIRKRALKSTSKPKPLAGVCWLCLAGQETTTKTSVVPTAPFEDFTRQAGWIPTMPAPAPWREKPTILRSILHHQDVPSFLKIDLFHVLNMGVYRDYAGSALCLLLAKLDGTSQEQRMSGMNGRLRVYLQQKRERLHIQKLTVNLIGADSPMTFAVGSWSKGSDSVILMGFVEWLVEDLGLVTERPYSLIHCGARCIHTFMRELYAGGAFLLSEAAVRASQFAYGFLSCYSKLAEYAMERRYLLWNLVPKLHYIHHVAHYLEVNGTSSKLSHVLSPVCDCTHQCEDFVGHVARLSRRVSPILVHSRVLRRYLAALAVHIGLLD